jgi:hypothetical protein
MLELGESDPNRHRVPPAITAATAVVAIAAPAAAAVAAAADRGTRRN